MRLTRLSLAHYGNFAAAEIVLDPLPGRINLVVAPNGAGKSVLRQAFGDLLFGIGGQSPMVFRYPTKGLRLFADAIGPSGKAVRFGRRKGHGNTLIDEQGEALLPSVLDPLLRGASRPLLEQLFALDTERLRRGGSELLATGGSLAEALLAAAGGLRQAKALGEALAEARDALAPLRRAERRPFYRALDGLLEARRRTRQIAQKPEERARREAELAKARGALGTLNEECRRLAAAQSQLERIRRIRPILAALDDAEAWLDAHATAPALPADLAVKLAGAREAVRRADEALGAAVRRRDEAAREAASVVPDEAILAEAAKIGELARDAGAARQAWDDLPGCEEARRLGLARMTLLLADLGRPAPLGQDVAAHALGLRAAKPDIAAARRLIAENARLSEAVGRLPALIASKTAAVAELAAAPALTARVPDSNGLPALLREIRSQGEPGANAGICETTLRTAHDEAARTLAAVPGWTAGIAALDALAPPPAGTIDALDRAREDAARTSKAERTATENALGKQEAARAALAALRADGTLPEDAAIADARGHRDAGWHLVFRQAFADKPAPAELSAWAGAVPLGLAYEQAVATADRLADGRIAASNTLARAETLTADLARLAQQVIAGRARSEDAAVTLSAARAVWRSACVPLGLHEDASRAEMSAFVGAREAALSAERHRRSAQAASEALAARHADWTRRLAAAMGTEPAASCAEALIAAETQRDRAEAAVRAHDMATERLRQNRETLDTLQTELREHTASLGAWWTGWRALLAGLGRQPDETPDHVADLLGLMGELEMERQHTETSTERIGGMTTRTLAFSQAVASVAETLGETPTPPLQALYRMDARLARARDDVSRRAVLDKASRAAVAGHDALAERADRAKQDHRDAIEAAGAEDDAQAEHLVALSQKRAAHEADRASASAMLREAGDGLGLAVLREEAASLAPDEAAARMRLTATAQEAAQAEAQAQAASVSLIVQAMAQESDADAILRSAADEASNAASLGRALEEALLQHLAGVLLARAMASVETQGDRTLVGRIGEAFASLTGGAYPAVAVRPGEDGVTELAAVERGFEDEEPRGIKALSEGTRDQLFLALRLVAIEDYAAGDGPPLPFIADDVLQTFDDTRALATLRTLLDFSRTTQVIVLTHHEHILSVAASLPPGSVHVQRLP